MNGTWTSEPLGNLTFHEWNLHFGTSRNLTFHEWNLHFGTSRNLTFHEWNLHFGTSRNLVQGFGRLPQTTPKLYWKNPKPFRLLGKKHLNLREWCLKSFLGKAYRWPKIPHSSFSPDFSSCKVLILWVQTK